MHRYNSSDINGDGAADLNDFNLVLASLGKHPGQQGYRAAADINDDGVVNEEDLLIVTKNILAS